MLSHSVSNTIYREGIFSYNGISKFCPHYLNKANLCHYILLPVIYPLLPLSEHFGCKSLCLILFLPRRNIWNIQSSSHSQIKRGRISAILSVWLLTRRWYYNHTDIYRGISNVELEEQIGVCYIWVSWEKIGGWYVVYILNPSSFRNYWCNVTSL
jgi:hypothetical protein